MAGNHGKAASDRLERANYASPTERTDVCSKCKHATPYQHARPGTLLCRFNGTYVASRGICDNHTLIGVEKTP